MLKCVVYVASKIKKRPLNHCDFYLVVGGMKCRNLFLTLEEIPQLVPGH